MLVVCFDWFNAVLPVNVCQRESDGVNALTPCLFPWLIEDQMLVCWVTLVQDSDVCVCLCRVNTDRCCLFKIKKD